ncbi:hypothetical protein EHEL_021120 [Encephalitozoon hellem ATCC 50504]|nr:uncharacterized protein EHEL_021120 [Encephalitozoon hellem ATCC 50504]AFM97866.1 hypothetical protein EHEL_021120 [Encephalitozoon hellem ATCC 50504]UTX42644.1 hypothetical protein GPU96_02g03590 [Encephalitozoon hellem]|eukprot:XP_003886847.1 hypothetical protein EHEL_021120 [Encephalitozoon hellem ATCC 50504]
MDGATFSKRISVLDRSIRELEVDASEEKESKIEDMFRICDRLVECGQQSPRLVRQYNELKNRYKYMPRPYKELDDEISACKIHIEAMGRKGTIDEVAKSVQEVIAVSDYINYAVNDAILPIDNVMERLEEGEQYGMLINEQLGITRQRKLWRAGIIRSILLILFILVAVLMVVRLSF